MPVKKDSLDEATGMFCKKIADGVLAYIKKQNKGLVYVQSKVSGPFRDRAGWDTKGYTPSDMECETGGIIVESGGIIKVHISAFTALFGTKDEVVLKFSSNDTWQHIAEVSGKRTVEELKYS